MCGEENNPELTVAERKKILRKKAKTVLKEYFSDRELAKAASASILDYFIQSDIYKAAPAIFGFMPMPDEVDVIPILERALKDGKKVSVPKMIPGTNQMEFYEITSLEQGFSKDNAFSIREPENSSSLVKEIPDESVLLVPGLAFNLSGARLGRGKGYYDRYLSGVRGKNISFCGVCVVPVITKGIPCAPEDITMTHILNEYGLVKCSEGLYRY